MHVHKAQWSDEELEELDKAQLDTAVKNDYVETVWFPPRCCFTHTAQIVLGLRLVRLLSYVDCPAWIVC